MITSTKDFTALLPGYEPDTSVPFLVCTPAGTVIAKNNIKSRKASTDLEGASLFDYVDIPDKIRVSEFVSRAASGDNSSSYVRFDVKAMHGYHYAFAETAKGFGNTYIVVYLFATKKDFLASSTHREKQMTSVISDHKKRIFARCDDRAFSSAECDMSALLSESLAFTDLLDVLYNFKENNSPFNITEANERIIYHFSYGSGRNLTDCDIARKDMPSRNMPDIFITNRDLTNYTKLICALIFALTHISSDRKIYLATDCFAECARITLSTSTDNTALLSFRSTDVHALCDIIPSAALRIMIADCIAARTGVRILTEGYPSAKEFAFSLTVTDNELKHLEFKHGDIFEGFSKRIEEAAYSIFPKSITNSK